MNRILKLAFLVVVLFLLFITEQAQAQITLLSDTFGSAAGSLITAHTSNNGSTYTSLGGGATMTLDGAGMVYSTAGSGLRDAHFLASGTNFAVNTKLTYTATFNAMTDANYSGIFVADASGNVYQLTDLYTGYAGGGGFQLERQSNTWISSNGTSGTEVALARSSVFAPSGIYTATFTLTTNGSVVTMSAVVMQGSTPIWSSGNITDTTYPAVGGGGVGVRGFVQTFSGTATTGHHIGNLLAVVVPTMNVSPTGVPISSSGNTITLSGNNTAWTGGTTFNVTAGTIAAMAVNSPTSATLTFNAPAVAQAITISDTSDLATAILFVGISVTDVGFYFSPGNWFIQGMTSATTPSAGAYFYFTCTCTSATLLLDTSALGSNPAYIRSWADSGASTDTNIMGLSSVILGSGLPNSTHTFVVLYRGRQASLDSWNTPVDGVVVTGMVTNIGATTSAPNHFTDTALFLGDSRVEGWDDIGNGNGSATSQDAMLSHPWGIAHALQVEFGEAAYGGLGWAVGGATNVPALSSSWNLLYSGHPRDMSSYKYIFILNMGANDFSNSIPPATVQAAVKSTLTDIRAANSNAKIFVTAGGYATNEYAAPVTAGFNSYQAATPDPNAFLIQSGLTATEAAALRCGGFPSNSSFLTTDCLHPNAIGQQWLATGILNSVRSHLNGVTRAYGFIF